MASLDERAVVGVGIVVRNSEGDVLLGKRRNSHGEGQWSLPGGKPDGGEHPSLAAVRELYEETGLVAYGLKVLPLWTYDRFEAEGFHFVTLYFECWVEADPETREPNKCYGWEWFDTSSLPEPLFCGARDAIEASLNG